MTADEIVGCHHQLYRHELEQALGVGDGQGGLAYCRPWGCKESDTTEWLNWTNWTHSSIFAWRIPWTEETSGSSSWGHKESEMTEQLTLSLFCGHKTHNLVHLCYLPMRGDSVIKCPHSKGNPCQTPGRQRENHLPSMSLLQTNLDVTV